MGLTRRQAEVLAFIREYSVTRGYAPTLEEIGGNFGLASVATVHKHVANLVEKGYLRTNDYREWLTAEGMHNSVVDLPGLSGHEVCQFCDFARRQKAGAG